MSTSEIVVSKKLVYGIGIGLSILFALLLFRGKSVIPENASVKGNQLIAGSAEKFAFLSGQGPQRSVGST